MKRLYRILLRDYYAGIALRMLWAKDNSQDWDMVADSAFQFAEEMITQRTGWVK